MEPQTPPSACCNAPIEAVGAGDFSDKDEVHVIPCQKRSWTNPLSPSAALLSKLGSIAVHVEEMLSIKGHDVDRVALQTLLDDVEVREWISAMSELALIPIKR